MANDIKITMLGATGSGKTCYMLGMYATMQIGVNGLTLSAQDLDDDIRLTDMWERLVEIKDNKRWPPGNDNNPIKYTFNFNYGFRPIMQFEWLDYRGGAIADLTSEQDVPALINQLAVSHCVFLCVSGESLTEPLTSQRLPLINREMRINRMNMHMARVGERVKPTSQRPFPVVIVLTKYDLCAHRPMEEVIEDVKKLFPALFAPNAGWLTLLCPVSLGRELATNLDAGTIKPINVYLPVAFAIYARFREFGIVRKAEVSETQTALQRSQQRGWLWRFFNSDTIGQDMQRLQQMQSEMEEIQSNMALLAQELSQTNIFLDGKEIGVGV